MPFSGSRPAGGGLELSMNDIAMSPPDRPGAARSLTGPHIGDVSV